MMQYDVVTIGGGFSGLITACRAAELGLQAASDSCGHSTPTLTKAAYIDDTLTDMLRRFIGERTAGRQ